MVSTSTCAAHLDARPRPTAATTAAQVGGPSRAATARAVGVVVGGPVLLDLLELLGPVSALARWPRFLPAGPLRRTARCLTAVGVVAPVVDHALVRPWLRRWGSSSEERTRRLPGDAESEPLIQATRAVTVHAPAQEVWRWLVQIGQDRGGFYSYDWLENLAGCELRSAEEIHDEWQTRNTGDTLPLGPWYATRLAEVHPPHALVIENWGAYVIEPVDDSTCRLLARSHAGRDSAGVMYALLIELAHAIMERKMLLGIKGRAELSTRRRSRRGSTNVSGAARRRAPCAKSKRRSDPFGTSAPSSGALGGM